VKSCIWPPRRCFKLRFFISVSEFALSEQIKSEDILDDFETEIVA
jgi:hypothetical protein